MLRGLPATLNPYSHTMYTIKPNYAGVIDAMTDSPMPLEGIQRAVLLPPDHVAERSGDVVITENPTEAAATAADGKSAKTKP